MTEPEKKIYMVTTAQTAYETYPIRAANAEHAKSIWRSMRHGKGQLLSESFAPGEDEHIIDTKEYDE